MSVVLVKYPALKAIPARIPPCLEATCVLQASVQIILQGVGTYTGKEWICGAAEHRNILTTDLPAGCPILDTG